MTSTKKMKKSSKISSALKFYFIENLYWRQMSLKEAAERCNLNYSTGKIILNNLNSQEKAFINNLKRKKKRSRDDCDFPEMRCSFKEISQQELSKGEIKKVQIFSRVQFDYFQKKKRKNTSQSS